uniref:thrombospondin type-1 domain-containing protein 7A-like n=1 Tax=Myxine glutinosa TaxID=7769 RepID=UPI00358E60CD
MSSTNRLSMLDIRLKVAPECGPIAQARPGGELVASKTHRNSTIQDVMDAWKAPQAEWSTCQLSWRASCGPGIQTRLADCVRSDGRSVDLELCEQHGLDKLWRLTMPCTISCPLNCHLSDWESWSDCSHSCGIEGMMVRHRRVLKSNRANGRPCLELLQQRKPCPVRPCYHWHYGHWSACTLQPSQVQCGEGVRLRNVSCMMSDGVVGQASRIVEDKHCARRDNEPRAVTLPEQIPCTVPCAA